MSVREEVISDGDPAVDHNVSQQHGLGTDRHIFVDHNVRSDMRVASNLGTGMNHRCGMRPRNILQRPMKKFERVSEG